MDKTMLKKICSIPECGKKVCARGWCSAHYSKWQRHGDPLYARKYDKIDKCSVKGCERAHHAKGYCSTHWMKMKRSGTLEPVRETKEYKEKWLDSRLTELSKIDKVRDAHPKRRGFYAVRIVNELKSKAQARNIDWDLSQIDAYQLVISKCHYCGYQPDWPGSRCGLDRVNNFKGYRKDNVVACCYSCNTAKGIKTQKEFKAWGINLYENFCK